MACQIAQLQRLEARRLLMSVSPFAGASSSQRTAQQVAAELESAGFLVTVTTDLRELGDLANRWREAGELRAVLACGGDGTAAEVRNRTPLEVPLLIVPAGTENLLGGYISQSPSPKSVLATVEEGVIIGLDLCQAVSERVGSRYFLMMISAGFDADVVRRLHERRRGHITRFSYVQPTLKSIRSYEYPEMQLYCAGDALQREKPLDCRWLFGFNLPLYACGWRLAPNAVGSDGLLDVCTFRRGSFLDGVRYFWHVMRGDHFQLADARWIRGETFRLEAAGTAEVPYQLDGDFGGVLPVDVTLLPGKLRLLVMPEVAQRLGYSLAELL